MVYYLKINRREEYTYQNLQKWIDVIAGLQDAAVYVLCDDMELEASVRERISEYGLQIVYMGSERSNKEVREIITAISNERWEKAGYAHITTFYHAREKGYQYFWNIDADDTLLCLSAERIREFLSKAEDMAERERIPLLSLDMWYSKSRVNHWTFGITFTDNREDWLAEMKRHLQDSLFKGGSYPPNIDGYFTYLKELKEMRIESFYAENLRFLHYSNDFFRRPWASGFYHWKEGVLSFPVLKECFGIADLGEVNIPEEVLRIEMGISDIESCKAMINNCYRSDYNDLAMRYKK